MNVNVIKTFENIGFDFESPIEVQESTGFKSLIRGTLLSEGISRNGHLYTIEELENVVQQCKDLPIFFGTTTGIDPNTGRLSRNIHDTSKPPIGKVLRAWLEGRKIKFIGEVFGSVSRMVTKGFGISIKGFAKNAKYVVTESKQLVLKIGNLIMHSVQLFSPHTARGMESAQVESVEVQESMVFDSVLSPRTLNTILALLASEGEI